MQNRVIIKSNRGLVIWYYIMLALLPGKFYMIQLYGEEFWVLEYVIHTSTLPAAQIW